MLRQLYTNQAFEQSGCRGEAARKGGFEAATSARSDFPCSLRPVFDLPHSQAAEKQRDSQRRCRKQQLVENRSWAVATPLCAASQPPNAFGAGGRYRPSCSSDLLAPSLAKQKKIPTQKQRRSNNGTHSESGTKAREKGRLCAS